MRGEATAQGVDTTLLAQTSPERRVDGAALGAVGPDLVTVIVPVRDEERTLGRCLDSILSQSHSSLEVLVVEGGSRDNTRSVVRRYAARDGRVRLLDNPRGTIPSALNEGLDRSRGRWVVRVDGHASIRPDYVRRAVAHLGTGRWGGVGGRKEGVAITPAGRAVAAAMTSRFGVGNSVYHYGRTVRIVDHVPFGAYPTSVLRSLGGWDERLNANEDYELDLRIRQSGLRLLFDPSLTISWQCRPSVDALFRQYRRYGKGKADVARLHPGSLGLRHLAAPGLLLAWVAAAALAARWALLPAIVAGPYLVGLVVASAAACRRVWDRRAWLWVPPAFVAMHVAWGAGFWEGALRQLGRALGHRPAGEAMPRTEGDVAEASAAAWLRAIRSPGR